MEQLFFTITSTVIKYPGAIIITVSLLPVVEVIYRCLKTLISLRYHGIPILAFNMKTIKSLFSGDNKMLFENIMDNLKECKMGLIGWLTPVGKPFIVIGDEKVLEQIIVTNQSKLTKFHAFGILNFFRNTTLQSGPAWKVVHRIASKFPIHDSDLQMKLKDMLSRYIDGLKTYPNSSNDVNSSNGSNGHFNQANTNNNNDDDNSYVDFAQYTKDFYWELVILLVCGDITDRALIELYKQAWITCIAALSLPLAHVFPYTIMLPIPTIQRYRSYTTQLRKEILTRIQNNMKIQNFPSWCVLSVIREEMSAEDQLEVAMEFLFTGASSVTTTLIWYVWHIASSSSLQHAIYTDIHTSYSSTVQAENQMNGHSETDNSYEVIESTPINDTTKYHNEEIVLSNGKKNDMSSTTTTNTTPNITYVTPSQTASSILLDACLRETLRLYSPIHIGRLSKQAFTIINKLGETVTIPRGSDIFCNMWFIHRDDTIWNNANSFNYERFLEYTTYNIPHFHPFSMGVRSCPGQRIAYSILKLIVGNLVNNFDMNVKPIDTKYKGPNFDNNLMLPVTPLDVYIQFKERHSNKN